MKKFSFIILATAIFLFTAHVHAQEVSKKQKVDKKEVVLKITGMTCAGCSGGVHKARSNTTGVIDDNVSYPGDTFTITYDAKKTTTVEIIAVIEKLGYKAEKSKS
jgi:copper chaperone CopZ